MHVRRCKMHEAFKSIYPVGLTLWNIMLSKRIDTDLAVKTRLTAGVAQVIPNIGGYNMIVEIPATFKPKLVLNSLAHTIKNHFTEYVVPKQPTETVQ